MFLLLQIKSIEHDLLVTTFPRTQTREAHVSNKERVGRIERAALMYTHYLSLAQHHTIGRRLSLSWLFLGKEKRRPAHTSNMLISQRGFPRDWLLSHLSQSVAGTPVTLAGSLRTKQLDATLMLQGTQYSTWRLI